MNELETEYQGKVDFYKYDLTTQEGYCEFARYGFAHIPAMLYISAGGRQVERTEEVMEKEQLRQKLDNLLKSN